MENNKRRFSRQRASILQILRAQRDHLSAKDVYETVRQELPNISLGTVYRNLQTLVEEGKAKRLRLSNVKSEFFDAITDAHAHFFCERCERIFDIETNLDFPSLHKEAHANNFQVQHMECIVYGECSECAASKTAGTRADSHPN